MLLNLLIKSQPFREPLSLGCDLHMYFSFPSLSPFHVFQSSLPPSSSRRLEGAEIGYISSIHQRLAGARVGYFPFSWSSRLCRIVFLESRSLLMRTKYFLAAVSEWLLSPSLSRTQRIFLRFSP